jgi:hypothetical protein
MPSASNQVALSQLYATDDGTSNVDVLCAHLVLQCTWLAYQPR